MIRLHKLPLDADSSKFISDSSAAINGLLAEGNAKDAMQLALHCTRSDRFAVIRKVLEIETHSKCAYCESRILHIAVGDVEHIIPKSIRPEAAMDWSNLTLTCSICNARKGKYSCDDLPLVNPFVDEPLEHLFFLEAFIEEQFCTERGRRTLDCLALNRDALVARRYDILGKLKSHYVAFRQSEDPLKREAYRRAMMRMAEPSAEYSAASLSWLRRMRLVEDPLPILDLDFKWK